MPQCLVDFAKLLAHEMKGPLLMLELRLRSLDDGAPAARECLEELERLQRLVDRVLAWNDAEGLRSESFDLAPIIERLEQRFRPIVEHTGSTLAVVNTEARTLGDAEATEIVLSNLLDNAVRHAGQGARIELRAYRGDENIKVEVEDSGVGVPESARDRVFEPFHRSESTGGSGLGLFFARQLAEAQGGSLDLFDSTRFVLTMPSTK